MDLTADVALHITGSPAVGTVAGDCGGTYQVTGTIAPPEPGRVDVVEAAERHKNASGRLTERPQIIVH